MDDEEPSDVEEDIYRPKDHGKKSRKQESKEASSKKDGSKRKYATTTYVWQFVFAVAGFDLHIVSDSVRFNPVQITDVADFVAGPCYH